MLIVTPSPWLIVTIFALVFAGLFYIGWRNCNGYVRGMALMAGGVVTVYSWIGISIPDIDLRVLVVRYLFFFLGGAALFLIIKYIAERWKHGQ